MTTLAEPRHAGRAARPVRQTRPARSAARRVPRTTSALSGGIVSIVGMALFGVMLVALNVGVLELNVELDRLGRERSDLLAEIASTQARLSSAAASARIESGARARLGLIPADPELTTYVSLH